jgi:membrane-bound acyltransferase YfiQ involved in biofilm formation
MFIIGIRCARGGWLDKLNYRSGRRWLVSLPFLSLGTWIAFMLAGGAYADIKPFYGGVTWQSAVFALWQSYVLVSMSLILLAIGKEKFNKQGKLTSIMSAESFSVYVIHTPILLGLILLFSGAKLIPIVKFALLMPIGVTVCFAITHGLIKLFQNLRPAMRTKIREEKN